MPAAEASMDEKELFLRQGGARGLEMFVRLEGPAESHFYAQGLSLADFGRVFAAEIRPLDVLVTRMPPEFLNPNYWEPFSKEAENAVREKMTGIIARTDGDRPMLWRSDRVARSRLLRDGLDVPVDLQQGYMFRLSGEGLLELGRAWSGRDRFEWAGLSEPPKGAFTPALLEAVHTDLARMKLSLREEALLYSAHGDGLTRVAFAHPERLSRAIHALVRGFVYRAADGHLGRMNGRVLDQIARLADGVGFSADPTEDVVDKGRTVEVALHLGRTPWGVAPSPGENPLRGDEKLLLYYDRISGLWAVSS